MLHDAMVRENRYVPVLSRAERRRSRGRFLSPHDGPVWYADDKKVIFFGADKVRLNFYIAFAVEDLVD